MSKEPFVPVSYQYFSNMRDWVNNGKYALTGHARYNNTEVVAAEQRSGWQGHHFTAMCFDQKGRRCLSGADFQRAEIENTYPIWWVWPDQIADLLMAAHTQSPDEEAQRADTGSQQGQSQPDTEDLSSGDAA